MIKNRSVPHERFGNQQEVAPKPNRIIEKMYCGAKTRASGTCKKSPMKNGRCRLHGGKSTGPKTQEGRVRSALANLKHGKHSMKTKAENKEIQIWIEESRKLLKEFKNKCETNFEDDG